MKTPPRSQTNKTNGQAVMRLAYLLWERAGAPPGREEEFWRAAERQLRGMKEDREGLQHTEVVAPEFLANLSGESARQAPPHQPSAPG